MPAGLGRSHEVPDGGGLTARARSRREQVRLQAAQMFAQDTDARQIARSLRVSTKSVDAGPGRGAGTRLSGVEYTRRGVSYLLHRLGFTPQVAVHRAAERDEDAIAEWRSQAWAKVRG
jgi:Winged helix-turn helix